MATWTTLKQKIIHRLTNPGTVQVYQPWTKQQVQEKDYLHQLSMKDFLNIRASIKNKEYDQQLWTEQLKYQELEKKLEQIRDLITAERTTLNKLKNLVKRGEI